MENSLFILQYVINKYNNLNIKLTQKDFKKLLYKINNEYKNKYNLDITQNLINDYNGLSTPEIDKEIQGFWGVPYK